MQGPEFKLHNCQIIIFLNAINALQKIQRYKEKHFSPFLTQAPALLSVSTVTSICARTDTDIS
jgi:hypothetical protein